jgi:hypothetical protein
MSTEILGGLSGSVGEAKCKVGQYKTMGWMFVAWIFILTTPSRSGLMSIQSSFQWVPGTHSQGLKQPKRDDSHFAPMRFYLTRRCWGTGPLYLHSLARNHLWTSVERLRKKDILIRMHKLVDIFFLFF